MNITISGDLGAGKTTTAAILRQDGWNVVAGGDSFRKVARDMHMSLQELTNLSVDDRSFDERADSELKKMMETSDHTVFDSRMGYFFAPLGTLNVMLTCDPEVAAKRVYLDHRSGESYRSVADAKQGLADRCAKEKKRYGRLYDTDPRDKSNYHLVIDTTDRTPQDVAAMVEAYARGWLRSDPEKTPFWIADISQMRVEHGRLESKAEYRIDFGGSKYHVEFTERNNIRSSLPTVGLPSGAGRYGVRLDRLEGSTEQCVWYTRGTRLKDIAKELVQQLESREPTLAREGTKEMEEDHER